MKKMVLTVAVLALACASAAGAEKEPQQGEQAQQAGHRALIKHVGAARVATWRCQDQLGLARTKASDTIWSLPRSTAYRRWVASQWKQRQRLCERALDQRSIPATRDWVTAVKLVQRIYPGTSGWLLFISRREGGHGGFVMNHQGSGAGGWMQFMSSTYYAYNDRAFSDARSKGFVVPESANAWTHPLGQALTAGFMRYTGLDGCHWCL